MPYAWYEAWPPGYYQTCCARSGTIWAWVLPCSNGRRSTTVQPYRSVFPGHQSYWMEQSNQEAIPQQQWPCKSKFQKAGERPLQYSSHNYSRLHYLITLAQIAEGKKLVEPTEVSIEDYFEVYFLDQEYSGLHDDKFGSVLSVISTYLKLHIGLLSLLSIAAAEWTTACSTSNDSDTKANLQLDDMYERSCSTKLEKLRCPNQR